MSSTATVVKFVQCDCNIAIGINPVSVEFTQSVERYKQNGNKVVIIDVPECGLTVGHCEPCKIRNP